MHDIIVAASDAEHRQVRRLFGPRSTSDRATPGTVPTGRSSGSSPDVPRPAPTGSASPRANSLMSPTSLSPYAASTPSTPHRSWTSNRTSSSSSLGPPSGNPHGSASSWPSIGTSVANVCDQPVGRGFEIDHEVDASTVGAFPLPTAEGHLGSVSTSSSTSSTRFGSRSRSS